MKTVCDFCKTEYSLDKVPTTPVQCAVCGHIWTASAPRRKNSLLVLIAAFCALLAAIVFTFVIMTQHASNSKPKGPLVAEVSSIRTANDDLGGPHFIVTGRVINRSDEIYGVPDLIIISLNDAGDVIAQQKFMPSATLLDAGESVSFTHRLSVPISGVKRITVELKDAFLNQKRS